LYFCDFGGSSLGVRTALKSPQLVEFIKENPHLKLEISMRRNYHPYISSSYINGYVKDQSLKNMNEEEIIGWLKKVNSEFGRRPLKHNSVKVVAEHKSIQGEWTDTLWN
jgi:large subunit ribosomal protein L43